MVWTSIEGICESKGWIMANTFSHPPSSVFPHSLASWRGAGFLFLWLGKRGKVNGFGRSFLWLGYMHCEGWMWQAFLSWMTFEPFFFRPVVELFSLF